MRRHDEQFFGFTIDPGPDEVDTHRPVYIQLLSGAKGAQPNWPYFGPKFPAAQLDDLINALKSAKHLLETHYTKSDDSYRPRPFF